MKRRRFALGLVAAPAWAQTKTSTAQPNVQVLPDRLPMPGLGRERGLRLYLPPSYATQPERRYPVIYLHDAQNLFDDATAFAGEWGVDETLNALARSTGFEAIVVGIDHGDARRIPEMLPWPHAPFTTAEGAAYVDFVALTVKPWIDARWRTRPDAASTAIGGASIGGSISHYALLRHPAAFGRAAIFSPSYWSMPAFFEQVQREPAPATARLFIHIGAAEVEQMLEPTRRMHALLVQQPAAVELRVAPGARHNEAAWRAAFEPALRWLFDIR
ncbi:MAG TPA: alpha/beta hydrolase-fold protein [Burkholderiaceae bacterium]|nr:alpha/beta hydrolase-fold protein [Burkholderiaceae bacterium]